LVDGGAAGRALARVKAAEAAGADPSVLLPLLRSVRAAAHADAELERQTLEALRRLRVDDEAAREERARLAALRSAAGDAAGAVEAWRERIALGGDAAALAHAGDRLADVA